MLGSFDGGSLEVEKQGILEGLGVAKEDARANIGDRAVGTTGARGESKDATTKSAKKAKNSFSASANFKGGLETVAMRSHIMQMEVVMKGIGPETGRKHSTTKEIADGITNITVTAFNGAILVGGVRGSGFNTVASLSEEGMDLGRAAKFTTKIHADILVRSIA